MDTRHRLNFAALSIALSLCAGAPSAVSAEPAGAKVEPRRIADLLQLLSDSADANNPPIVRISIRNGHTFTGMISGCKHETGTCSIADRDGNPTLFNIGDVSAATVERPGAAKIALQGGKIYRETDTPPPFLTLIRNAQGISQRFGVGVNLSVPESLRTDLDCRFATDHVLNALGPALEDVNEDALGQDALRALTSGIVVEHSSGKALGLSSDKKAVTIHFDCTAPLDSGYLATVKEELKRVL